VSTVPSIDAKLSSSAGLATWNNVLADRTSRVDDCVKAAASLNGGGLPAFSIAAVGGYGRRELFPHSDVDILIAVQSEDDLAGIKEPLADFIRKLWDQGLRVSQSVRTIAECCRLQEQNVELHISLLDLRFLCGDLGVFDDLEKRAAKFYEHSGEALARALAELTRARHAKYSHTIYHLEPNIKETPGGIRDLQFLRWLTQLIPGHEAIRESLADLGSARSLLFALRVYLHQRSGRDNNLLSFEMQDDAARDLAGGTDPAEWMRSYFHCVREVSQAARRALEYTESLDPSLLRHFRDRRSRLSTTEYTVSRNRIFLRNIAETTYSAASVLRLFAYIARHGICLSWDAQRRLRLEAASLARKFADSPALWTSWSDLLSQPHAGLALHEMQEAGILAAAIPEWQSIDSLVVRDFYHRYTVDEHTLVAVEVIDRLTTGGDGTAKRLQELLREVEDIAVLRFALLLHDIGKGTKPGDHVAGSLETAGAIASRIGMPRNRREITLSLIERHLDLSLIMNSRDLDDPATARHLASSVRTLESLRYLTLLTYADISAVNPTAMTPWRLEQLWRTYSAGRRQLTRELDSDRIHGMEGFPSEERTPEFAKFLEGLPTRYLRTHTPEEVGCHCALARRADEFGVAVEVVQQKDSFLATVLATDRPGLFASICGALASFGLNIVKAEACANASRLALDQFRFTDPLRTLELNPTETDRLRKIVERVVVGTEDVKVLLKRRRAVPARGRLTQVAPVVRFDNEVSDAATLVEFVGEDRPGLLYDLATAFSAAGCDIELVLIDTEAHKALDVFYVTREGAKVDEEVEEQLKWSMLQAASGV
jgi:[protein-PII] uridylyltransferase